MESKAEGTSEELQENGVNPKPRRKTNRKGVKQYIRHRNRLVREMQRDTY